MGCLGEDFVGILFWFRLVDVLEDFPAIRIDDHGEEVSLFVEGSAFGIEPKVKAFRAFTHAKAQLVSRIPGFDDAACGGGMFVSRDLGTMKHAFPDRPGTGLDCPSFPELFPFEIVVDDLVGPGRRIGRKTEGDKPEGSESEAK